MVERAEGTAEEAAEDDAHNSNDLGGKYYFVADMMVEMEVDKVIKVATDHMRWRLTRWTPP